MVAMDDEYVEENMSEPHAPGIYLGLDEDEYHEDPSFSSSGVKNMTVSPLDYWVNSWMNPNKDDKPRPAMQLGKAYHKLVLEGREAFDACYAVEPDKADYPDALFGSADLKAHCKELGLKAAGTLDEMCERIREVDTTTELWPVIKGAFKDERGAREPLSKSDWEDLNLVDFVMRRSPSTKNAFVGGVPEVSMFWREGDTPMKARIDYVKPQALLDLKSFANQMNDEIVSAVAKEVARRRYFIQPVVYTRGWEVMKTLYSANGSSIIQGDGDQDVIVKALKDKRTRFFFVFLQTGGTPNVVVREFNQIETFQKSGGMQNSYWSIGEQTFRRALHLHQKFMAETGPAEPWIADFGNKPFQDIDFPIWMLNQPLEAIV